MGDGTDKTSALQLGLVWFSMLSRYKRSAIKVFSLIRLARPCGKVDKIMVCFNHRYVFEDQRLSGFVDNRNVRLGMEVSK
jgi:hypothetical protein